MACQAELCGEFAQTHDTTVFADVPIVIVLCLFHNGEDHGDCGTAEMRWLSLADLTHHDKHDFLDMPVVPEGMELASMQRSCETKRKVLQLCLPCIPVAPPQQLHCRAPPPPAAAQPPQFRILKWPKPASNPLASSSCAWSSLPPASAAARQLVQLMLPPGQEK